MRKSRFTDEQMVAIPLTSDMVHYGIGIVMWSVARMSPYGMVRLRKYLAYNAIDIGSKVGSRAIKSVEALERRRDVVPYGIN